jgi:hypothetical protein
MMLRLAAAAAMVLFSAWPASAQFGIGGRVSMVRGDNEADTESERFTGGHIRALLSPRTGLELALERRTDTSDDETLRHRQYPLQASLLLFPVRNVVAPYVLAGGGWYTSKIDTLEDDETISTESTRDFAWHAGFGAELRLGRHAALHGDYRYTRLTFGDDEEEEAEEGLSRFLPSHRGSMWTFGLTVYF